MNSGYCTHCDKTVIAHEKSEMNHWAHGIATLLTAGAWLVFWLIIAMTHKPAILCGGCGSTLKVDSGDGDGGFLDSLIGFGVFIGFCVWVYILYKIHNYFDLYLMSSLILAFYPIVFFAIIADMFADASSGTSDDEGLEMIVLGSLVALSVPAAEFAMRTISGSRWAWWEDTLLYGITFFSFIGAAFVYINILEKRESDADFERRRESLAKHNADIAGGGRKTKNETKSKERSRMAKDFTEADYKIMKDFYTGNDNNSEVEVLAEKLDAKSLAVRKALIKLDIYIKAT